MTTHDLTPNTDDDAQAQLLQDQVAESELRLAMSEAPKPYRIWTLYCAFKKSGVPSVGNFGSRIEPVVVIHQGVWNRMCEEIPALATARFEVGVEE